MFLVCANGILITRIFFPVLDSVEDFQRDLDYYSMNVSVDDNLFYFQSKIARYKCRLASARHRNFVHFGKNDFPTFQLSEDLVTIEMKKPDDVE